MFPSNTTKEVTLSDASECATAVVDVVVYADDTAEVTNEDALRDYLKPIAGRSPYTQKRE